MCEKMSEIKVAGLKMVYKFAIKQFLIAVIVFLIHIENTICSRELIAGEKKRERCKVK